MKLLFNFDGTLGQPDLSNKIKNILGFSITNILKIHLLAGGNIENTAQSISSQKSFYYPGVGSRGNFFTRAWRAAFAAKGVETILSEAMTDFYNNHKKNDKIYITGFSRGAAIARIFASKLSKLNIPIEFLGVFDTVASFGFPNLNSNKRPISDVLFENNTIAFTIKKALHIVGLDENRLAYRPTLMNCADNINEIWFPGTHSDIGGGNYDHCLSDLTLSYFLKTVKKGGLSFYSEFNQIPSENLKGLDQNNDLVDIGEDDLTFDPDEMGKIHYCNEKIRKALNILAPREGVVLKNNVPSNIKIKIHQSAINRKKKMKYNNNILDDQNYEIVGY
jgi:uncharacterized protein (DUF2235 family)